jgi:hypothetical protein
MDLRRSQRQPVPKNIWEEKRAPSAAKDTKITRKKRSYSERNSARTYCDWAASENCGIEGGQTSKASYIQPTTQIAKRTFKLLATGFTQLQTFQQLLTPAIVEEIILAINSFAENT